MVHGVIDLSGHSDLGSVHSETSSYCPQDTLAETCQSSSSSEATTGPTKLVKSSSFRQKRTSSISLRSAIYRTPGRVACPFSYEGGKSVKFLGKSTKRFETFLDGYNHAISKGFIVASPVEDWFAFVDEAETKGSKKKLLSTFMKADGAPSFNSLSQSVKSMKITSNTYTQPLQTSYRTAIFRLAGEDNDFPFVLEGGKMYGKPPHVFGSFLDAYNFATDKDFEPEAHRVQDWFKFVEDAEIPCEEKKLLAVFRRSAY